MVKMLAINDTWSQLRTAWANGVLEVVNTNMAVIVIHRLWPHKPVKLSFMSMTFSP